MSDSKVHTQYRRILSEEVCFSKFSHWNQTRKEGRKKRERKEKEEKSRIQWWSTGKQS